MSSLFGKSSTTKTQLPTASTISTSTTAVQAPIVHEQHIYKDATVTRVNENHVVREKHLVQEVPIIDKQVIHQRPVVQEKTIIHEKPIVHEKKVVQTAEERVVERPLVQRGADRLVQEPAAVLQDTTIVGDRSRPIVNEQHVFVDEAARVQEKHVVREKHMIQEVPVLEKTVVHERPIIQENTIIHEKPIIHEKAVVHNEMESVREPTLVLKAQDEVIVEPTVVLRDDTIVRQNSVVTKTLPPAITNTMTSTTTTTTAPSTGLLSSLKNVFSANVPQPAPNAYAFGTPASTTIAAAVPASDVNTTATLPKGPIARLEQDVAQLNLSKNTTSKHISSA